MISKWRILPRKGLFVGGKSRGQTSLLQKIKGALTKALRYDEQQLLLGSSRILLELFTSTVSFFSLTEFYRFKESYLQLGATLDVCQDKNPSYISCASFQPTY